MMYSRYQARMVEENKINVHVDKKQTEHNIDEETPHT